MENEIEMKMKKFFLNSTNFIYIYIQVFNIFNTVKLRDEWLCCIIIKQSSWNFVN